MKYLEQRFQSKAVRIFGSAAAILTAVSFNETRTNYFNIYFERTSSIRKHMVKTLPCISLVIVRLFTNDFQFVKHNRNMKDTA